MKTLLIVCAMILCVGPAVRLSFNLNRKEPRLIPALWAGLELVTLAIFFRFFTIGA